jgi:serine/threonine-protein kinase
MGAVWRARNELLEADVALKIMFRAVTDAAGVALQRAHSEARLAAQLHHPAICTALDYGLSDRGDPIVVSELLHGEGLDEVLRNEGRLSPTRAVQLLLPVLDGLSAAHGKGIVHRDVKPSNIFLARDDSGNLNPKLLDFGVARDVWNKQRITVAGLVCGTPDYMSPEQARGSSDVDIRSDIWSVCATLYELVTGRVPFCAENYNAVMFAVLHEPHSPITELAAEDRELVAIIERGLRKDRQQRFQSTRELSRMLATFLLSRGVDVDACGQSLRSRLSSAELQLSKSELALIGAATPRESQVAPTLRRSAVPRLQLTRRQLRAPTPRSAIWALGLASLLSLGAWKAFRPGSPLDSRALSARADGAPGEAVEMSSSVGEASPAQDPANEHLESLLPAQHASGVSAQLNDTATSERATPRSPESAARGARAGKTPKHARGQPGNALGYDFGL